MTGKNKSQYCFKRSSVYEIWCRKCFDEEKYRIEKEEIEEDEKKMRIEKIKTYKYIGETLRSVFEWAWEHQVGLDSLSPNPA